MSSVDFHIIIPARYQSSRFPGKLLQMLGDKTVLESVYQQALKANPKSIMIATDNEQIYAHANAIGAPVMMTSIMHETGTDRLSEVVTKGQYQSSDIIVNVQGDEPFIKPELITQVAENLEVSHCPVATLSWPLQEASQLANPNVVKVVCDAKQKALYFSRAPIPYHRDNPNAIEGVYKHIGLYAYRASFLAEWPRLSPSPLEQYECLEQLRVLAAGLAIHVGIAPCEPLQDINTPEDLARASKQQSHDCQGV